MLVIGRSYCVVPIQDVNAETGTKLADEITEKSDTTTDIAETETEGAETEGVEETACVTKLTEEITEKSVETGIELETGCSMV